jgi:hypothetical protein
MTGSLTINKNLYVMDNVGVGTSEPDIYGSARLTVKSKNNNGGSNTVHTATPESVLALVRDGVPGWSWQNVVDFRLGRYDDGLYDYDTDPATSKVGNRTLRPRTQLDIVLTHGNLDKLEVEKYTNVMTLRSNGNVGIGRDNPQQRLEVNGYIKLGSNANLFALGNLENVRVIHGRVVVAKTAQAPAGDTIIEQGTGWSVKKIGVGYYTIEFNPPFGDIPILITNVLYDGGDGSRMMTRPTDLADTFSRSSYRVLALPTDNSNTAHDVGFTFIAIGSV